MPLEFYLSALVDQTGWTFDQVLNADARQIELLLLYKRVKQVVLDGGDFDP